MELKIKRLHKDAVIPQYMTQGAAAMDLTAVSAEYDEELTPDNDMVVTYHTGIAVEIPQGYVGLLFPRSSVYKTGLLMCNSVGVIDSDYRGEILAKFRATPYTSDYEIGDRIAQLMIVPVQQCTIIEANELSKTQRGIGGHGSTGK